MMGFMTKHPLFHAFAERLCFLILPTLLVVPIQAVAATYYADAACIVQGDGTSTECASEAGGAGAFAQITDGLSSLKPGDTLQLAAGTYDQRIRIQAGAGAPAGTKDNPITIRGAGMGVTVVRGDNLDATTVIFQMSYWSLEHLTVQNGKPDDPEAEGGCVKVQGDIEGVALRQMEVDGQKRSALGIGILCIEQRTLCPKGTLIEDVLSHDQWLADERDAHCISLNYAGAEEFGISDTVIRRVTAYGCDGDGVQIVNPKTGGGYSAINTLIEDSTFYRKYDVADEENAIDAKGPRGLTIRGNTMYGFRPTVTSQSGAVVIVHHAAIDVVIENNVIYEGAQSIRVGKGSYKGEGHPERFVIRNNVIYDATREGAGDSQGGKGNGITIAEASDIKVLHNTIVNSAGTGIEVSQAASEIVLQGNLIVGSGEDAHELSVANPNKVTVSHTLIWGGDGPGSVLDVDDITAVCDTCLNADPLFLDGAAHDYHLSEGSPAINAGAPLDDVVTDYEGTARDEQPDLGAFEGTKESPPPDEKPEEPPEAPPDTAEPPPETAEPPPPDAGPESGGSASSGSNGGCGVAGRTSPPTGWALLLMFIGVCVARRPAPEQLTASSRSRTQ
jgi:hypothetical protein